MMGLALLSIGVILVVFALHRFGYIPHRVERVPIITNSPVSPTERLPDGEAVIVAGPKRTNETALLVVGIVLILAGGIIAVRYKQV